MTSSIYESIRLPTGLFPKNQEQTKICPVQTFSLICMTERTQQVYFPSPPSFLTSILLGLGFSLVGGCLEIDLWQV